MANFEAIKFEFKWKVFNLSMCKQKTGEYIRSPVFKVKPFDTYSHWALMLYPKGKVVEKSIVLHVQRTEDSGEDEITADVTLTFDENEFTKRNIVFKKGTIFDKFEVTNKFEVVVTDLHKPDDTLCIRCKMLFKREIIFQNNKYQRQKANLAENIYHVYKSEAHSDLVLTVKDSQILLHKCILAARCPALARYLNIEHNNRVDHVVMNDIELSVITKLLAYIYGEDLSILYAIKSSNSLDNILAAVEKFELEELKKRLIMFPTSYNACTTIFTRNYSLSWDVGDFIEAIENGYIFSPFMYKTPFIAEKWKFLFYLKKDSSRVDICIRPISGTESESVFLRLKVTVSVLNESFLDEQSYYFCNNEEDWVFPFPITINDDLVDSLARDENKSLTLIFTLTVSNGNTNSKIYQEGFVAERPRNVQSDFQKISVDILQLYGNGNFSDITLHVGHERIHAHKVILWARSPALRRYIDVLPSDCKDLKIDFMPKKTLEQFLIFMYSGIPTLENAEDVLLLLEAAMALEINCLIKTCSQYLEEIGFYV